MLTFHRMEDSIIPCESNTERKYAEKIVGGADELNGYCRLFLLPAVENYSTRSGPEPFPTIMMKALVD